MSLHHLCDRGKTSRERGEGSPKDKVRHQREKNGYIKNAGPPYSGSLNKPWIEDPAACEALPQAEPAGESALFCRSGRFYNHAGSNTAGTHFHAFDLTIFLDGANVLQVWIKSALCQIMGMADIVARHRFFPAYFTDFRHFNILLKR
jgi:hypothetical protein